MVGDEIRNNIFQEVTKCIEQISTQPFDKGLPVFRDCVWEIGEKYNFTGDEVVKIYFEELNQQK